MGYDPDMPRTEIVQRWNRATGNVSNSVWFERHPRLVIDELNVVLSAQDHGLLMRALGQPAPTVPVVGEVTMSLWDFEQAGSVLRYGGEWSSTAGHDAKVRA